MGDSPALCITAEAWRLMTAEPPAPTKPAEDDVRISEHCEVAGVVTGWEVAGKNGFPMKRYDIEEEAHNARKGVRKETRSGYMGYQDGAAPTAAPTALGKA